MHRFGMRFKLGVFSSRFLSGHLTLFLIANWSNLCKLEANA